MGASGVVWWAVWVLCLVLVRNGRCFRQPPAMVWMVQRATRESRVKEENVEREVRRVIVAKEVGVV